MASLEDSFRKDREPSGGRYSKDFIAYGLMWPLVDALSGQDWRTTGPIDDTHEFSDDENDKKDPFLDARLIAERYRSIDEEGGVTFYSDISLIVEFIIEGEERERIFEVARHEYPQLARALRHRSDLAARRVIAYGFGSDETVSIFVDTEIISEQGEKLWRSGEDGELQGEREVAFSNQDMDFIRIALLNLGAPKELIDVLDVIRAG